MVIQRSWKILSDTGSTSASSTEANRSPSAINSSSDDSNCSNQTTHSMVTSVASPLAPVKIEAAPAPPPPAVEPPVKYVTTAFMAETMLNRLRTRLGGPIAGNNATSESAMRALELLRISVQSAFDREIDTVIKRFMETFFKPAFKNIKENLGQNAVSEETLQKMSCALLENAKAQYNAFRVKPKPEYLVPHTVAHSNVVTTEPAVRVALKRPATKPAISELSKKLFPNAPIPMAASTPSQPLSSTLKTTQPAAVQPVQQQQPQQQPQSQQQQQQQPQQQLQQQQQQQQLQQQKTAAVTLTTARRQIFWNTANISTSTKFVLDVQANQAFGFGTDGKERLASKHPELIRYLPDSEDRDWLTAQNIISQQNRNSRFLFLIHDEVCRLQQTHDIYRTKPNVNLSLMHTFTVPDFMIQKMKLFFVDLNIKSRGLITNSFSMSTAQSNSHLRNALLQGVPASTTVVCTETASSTQAPARSVTTSNDTSTPTPVAQSRPRTSTLSSSHATLTALLNNSGGSSSSTTSRLRK